VLTIFLFPSGFQTWPPNFQSIHSILFYFWIQFLLFLFLFFIHWSIIEFWYSFLQFYHLIPIFHELFFHFDCYFFVNFFVYFLLVFNFIPQSKLMVYYFFNLVLIYLIFLLNFTLQLKINRCPLIIFYFNFYPHSFNYFFIIILCHWFFPQFFSSIFDLLGIKFRDFFMHNVSSLIIWVTSLKY